MKVQVIEEEGEGNQKLEHEAETGVKDECDKDEDESEGIIQDQENFWWIRFVWTWPTLNIPANSRRCSLY